MCSKAQGTGPLCVSRRRHLLRLTGPQVTPADGCFGSRGPPSAAELGRNLHSKMGHAAKPPVPERRAEEAAALGPGALTPAATQPRAAPGTARCGVTRSPR